MHKNYNINALTLDIDNNFLYSTSLDGTLGIWYLNNLTYAKTIKPSVNVTICVYTIYAYI